jgi:SpoVK/Ycf46/Vps4 family AAA+-type ATPase
MALLGLTLDEARHAIRRAMAKSTRLDADSLPVLLEEKRMLVNRTGLIQFIPAELKLEDIGGLQHLKTWVLERRKLFAQRDSMSVDIVPKGLLVMGISGCGKSLSAKAIASSFGLPLYRIDMTEIYSGRHGAAEAAFVEACRMLEQIAPAVCWFDEIEMGITSQETAGEQGRMFAFFLTWMQEKTRGLFVTATANRIDLLPAEMIRKGRFDEVFFVDLPNEEERMDICKIHLERRGIPAEPLGIERLKQFTRGWTGAELEQLVVSALTTAKLENREVTSDDLLNGTGKIVPLSKTMKEQVEHIRSWALDRAIRTAPRVHGGG